MSLGLAAVFTILTWFWACNPGRPWWRKPDIVTVRLVFHSSHYPIFAHRHADRLRCAFVRNNDRRRIGSLLRQRPRPAGATRQTYSCTPDCVTRVTLGDTSKDDWDLGKDTALPMDYFNRALSQTVTRNTQALGTGSSH